MDVPSKCVLKRERASVNRWHLEVRIETPEQVDAEITGWLKNAYEISG